jgi:hypothetical protein
MKRFRLGNLLRDRVEREVSGRYLSRADKDGMSRCVREVGVWVRRTFYQGSLEVRRPDGLALSFECLPALPTTDDGVDRITSPVVAGKGIGQIIDR